MSSKFPLLRILVPAASYEESQIPIPLWSRILTEFIATECDFFGLNEPNLDLIDLKKNQLITVESVTYFPVSYTDSDVEQIDLYTLNQEWVSLLSRIGIDAAEEIVFFKGRQQYATVDSLEGQIVFWELNFKDRARLEAIDTHQVYSFNIITPEDLRDGNFYGFKY